MKPKYIDPIIRIVVFMIKLLIDIFMFKYLCRRLLKIDIPPWLKFILYIRPPVIPHIIPAINEVKIGIFVITFNVILFVNLTNRGYEMDAITNEIVVSFFRNI